MNVLVVGYGSIGQRHSSIVEKMGGKVFVVSAQHIKSYLYFPDIYQALKVVDFDYIVISNATYLHYQTLKTLMNANYQGVVLVEKPLFQYEAQNLENALGNIFVAYNLRFSSVMKALKKRLQGEKMITFSAYVGQYLPSWRKNIDYRESASARKFHGGGVLRDLSHELDYVLWICGACTHLSALGGHYSPLEIDSEDSYAILMQCNDCPLVQIHVNYLDKIAKREIIINTEAHTFRLDFIRNELYVDDSLFFETDEDIHETYVQEHQALWNKDYTDFCSYQAGYQVVSLIEKIEIAAAEKIWVAL